MPLFAACLLSLLVAAPVSNSTPAITWDASTLHLVAADGNYARIIKLKSGAWLAGYSRGRAVWSSVSADRGATWSEAARVGEFEHGSATNAELIQLADGRVMFMFNERDHRPGVRRDVGQKGTEPDNGIAIAFSSDDGKTWSLSQRIYGGGPMWEPAAYQHGDDLSILFADEKPYPKTQEQQISRMVSHDGGKTWRGPDAVSFRQHHRDGMPVPTMLADGRTVIAIEDDGLSGTFKPAIVDLSDETELPVDGKSAHRWSALAEPLPGEVYAGAPYLARLGNSTVLSAQVAPPTGKRTMTVWVAGADAKRFDGASMPFGVAGKSDQSWNALMAIDDTHVLAITGTTIDGKGGVWAIEGTLAR